MEDNIKEIIIVRKKAIKDEIEKVFKKRKKSDFEYNTEKNYWELINKISDKTSEESLDEIKFLKDNCAFKIQLYNGMKQMEMLIIIISAVVIILIAVLPFIYLLSTMNFQSKSYIDLIIKIGIMVLYFFFLFRGLRWAKVQMDLFLPKNDKIINFYSLFYEYCCLIYLELQEEIRDSKTKKKRR